MMPYKLSLGEGPSSVDHEESDRKVNKNIEEFPRNFANKCLVVFGASITVVSG
jgi:hypothetical protein